MWWSKAIKMTTPSPTQAGGVRAALSQAGPTPELCSWFRLRGGGRGRPPGGGSTTPPQLVMPTLSSEVSDSLLEDLIAAHLVLPNRVTVPVKKGLDVTNLRFPLPCVSTTLATGHDVQCWGADGLRGECILTW